jgi:hypothetical protein
MRRSGQRPFQSVVAAGILSALAVLSWAAVLFGEDDSKNLRLVTLEGPGEIQVMMPVAC